MENHKQEVIDGFVKAVIPAVIYNENQWEGSEVFDCYDISVSTAYSIAEALYEKHSKTCKVCKELLEKQALEIF
jgi:hypothetical protein